MAKHGRATCSTFTTAYLTFALECTDFPVLGVIAQCRCNPLFGCYGYSRSQPTMPA
ncbi:hypothetical protein AA0116_g12369 [Alternaria tenuissima]|nr:hypothetical protein AA0116_g12369 [Alternaria tenuissima]